MRTTRQQALDRIDGAIIGTSVVYWDDSTRRYYVGPASDLDYLVRLMDDPDGDVARDAYSHWCSGTSHGTGYETEQEAIAAAQGTAKN